nr:hypothetical protein [Raoultella ornithinolytica]
MLNNLRLQLTKKFLARLVRFFLNLLKFFLPRRGAGNQREIITLSDVPLCASLAELFLDTGQRPCFTTEGSNAIYLPKERFRQRILPPRQRLCLRVILPITLV